MLKAVSYTHLSTGQVVHDVTKEPVETNTGASIVSTQNGNVVLSNGSVVAPEEIGGTVNEDKTISCLLYTSLVGDKLCK